MNAPDPIESVIKELGLARLARALTVSPQAIRKWQRARRMPRTEWTGETTYSDTIERLSAGRVTKQRLLQPWPAPDSGAAAGVPAA